MANILDGKAIAAKVRDEVAKELKELQQSNPDFKPHLTIVQVGGNEDSNVYIRMKTRAAGQCGISVDHVKLPREVTEDELILTIQRLNENSKVNAILLQLPLDSTNQINADRCTNTIAVNKDVDGLTDVNAGRLARGSVTEAMIPCTPLGCLELIRHSGMELSGKKAVVLGRSKIVGAPVADLLRAHNATVTVCHSRTADMVGEVGMADIVVVAIRQPQLVKKEWIKQGAVVIDVGINSIPDASKKSGHRLVGDVDYEGVCQVAGSVTPVPGGVGPMTVAMLMKNTLMCAKKQSGRVS